MSVLVVTTFLPRAVDEDDKAADVTVTDVCIARRPITCAPTGTSIRYLTNIMDPIN